MAASASPDTLFEVSWEVCNKVGGIHTVVSSKARLTVDHFGDRYVLLGPDLKNNEAFEETDEPDWVRFREAVALKQIRCRFGRWLIPGRPRVILVSFDKKYNQGQLLYELWERYGVDSLSGGWDYVEPVMFSYACGEVIAALWRVLSQDGEGQAVALFHEWMCGAGLLAVKKYAPEIGTVFTTHATILGRTLAGSGINLYRHLAEIAPAREAAAHHIAAKFSMETAAAREADCFTTVSEITAAESRAFLGRAPDVITTNGLDFSQLPDYSRNREFPESVRREILTLASRFLRDDLPPTETRLVGISGRYEWHNKGIDLFLEALGGLNQDLAGSPRRILAFCLVMAGHESLNRQAVQGDPASVPEPGAGWIATHRLYHEAEDPIFQACRRLGLRNTPQNPVKVIFVPAFLNGHDGFFNRPYYEVLSAFDLAVFPSFYEPWGYTPQESAALAVPTVTTDLAGFGLWALQTVGEKDGLCILRRRDRPDPEAAEALRALMRQWALCPLEELNQKRIAVRHAALGTSWDHFFPNYLDAFRLAAEKAAQRARLLAEAARSPEAVRTFPATGSITPLLRPFTAVTHLPPPLKRLRELAYNLWWSWNPEALDLFAPLAPTREREPTDRINPVRWLEEADPERLAALAEDPHYLERYHRILGRFDAYMSDTRCALPHLTHLSWSAPIAYFSTEYGLHESLPIYSGGLGVLSGDHLKSASDLNLPLVAVGLLYKNGYFRQRIERDGSQAAEYPVYDVTRMPMTLVKDDRGQPVEVAVELPGRTLYAQTWEVRVGRISLFLLDADIQKNTPDDRIISSRLYAADRHIRIRQEILLGIGGCRLLDRLGRKPAVYHLNEGHSAFVALERIRVLMAEEGLSFAEALEAVRGSIVFTTHTPVEAGNERFDRDIMEYYLRPFANAAHIPWSDLWRLGSVSGEVDKPFFMTVLALKTAGRVNGVSRLHGRVARRMWREVWKGLPTEEIPIFPITNGIHLASFVSPPMRELLSRYIGVDWSCPVSTPDAWNRVHAIPEAALWAARRENKERLLTLVQSHIGERFLHYAPSRARREEVLAALDPNALVIGFARRFAPYKRADLVLRDPDRLAAILNHSRRPVMILFAGKAHPEDRQGMDLIRKVMAFCNDSRFLGRILFLEDYDLALARALVQGCDVWLNTPQRPHEASGTSGQKAAVNGVLNLSIADGWWCEGADGENGWTIGPPVPPTGPIPESNDEADAQALYALLEETVVPLYFARDENGIPTRWVAMARHAIASLAPCFSSARMVREYAELCYEPMVERWQSLFRRQFAVARQIAAWKQHIPTRFASLRIREVRVEGLLGDSLPVGHALTVHVRVEPGDLKAEEIQVQFVAGPSDGVDFLEQPDVVTLTGKGVDQSARLYSGTYTVRKNGRHAFGIRVFPWMDSLASPLDSGLVLWA